MNGKKLHESTFPNGEINIMPDENLWVLEEEKAEITWQYSGKRCRRLASWQTTSEQYKRAQQET